jgi:hypothetical protein
MLYDVLIFFIYQLSFTSKSQSCKVIKESALIQVGQGLPPTLQSFGPQPGPKSVIMCAERISQSAHCLSTCGPVRSAALVSL